LRFSIGLTDDDLAPHSLRGFATPRALQSCAQMRPKAKNARRNLMNDKLFAKAVDLVTQTGNASIAWLQRRLGVGYGRAKRLVEALEAHGVVDVKHAHARCRGPIILVSANPDLAEIAAGIGTPYWLAKPFNVDALLALLERALRERIPPTFP
jgi:hypothetical protein